jgi:hypothetical protein
MPFYSITFIVANETRGIRAQLLCGKCRSVPNWHSGAADKSDLPIQLLCDECHTQCAEFLTYEQRDLELQELEERARTFVGQVKIERPKLA